MRYETVIGLEIHAELANKSKIYCSCSTEFGAAPNTHTCPICTGMPGTLPVLNKKVVDYAVMAGLAMNCSITEYGKQDRKNYFYPDLPKSYQTSQFDQPVCQNGYLEIASENGPKKIGITRIHIEEDAGKLIHDDLRGYTLVDYNRCGVPLIEIVTEPDLRSAKEAKCFLETVKSILEYLEISDCKMQEGSLRCDVNISVRPAGQQQLGVRTEMKNINSFSAAVRAIESESERQIDLLEAGKTVIRATRRWDDVKNQSFDMRSKEQAHDYRYFPEPDLVPIVIDRQWVSRIKNSLPELPDSRKKKYLSKYGLSDADAAQLVSSKKISDYFEDAVGNGASPKIVTNWLIGEIPKLLRKKGTEEIPFCAEYLAKTIQMTEKGSLSSSAAKAVIEEMFDRPRDPENIAKEKGLLQINDEAAVMAFVEKVIEENPQAVKEIKSGKDKAVGFIVGQVMRYSKGRANPQLINKLLKDILAEK